MLNSQHPNLKLTIEKAAASLSFFDVEIKIFDDSFKHLVYCKQSNTDLILNYHTNCPKICKSGLIMCSFHGVKLLCSNVTLFSLFYKEVKNSRRIFLQNSYPNYFFDLTLKQFKTRAKQKPRTNADNFLYRISIRILEIRHLYA